jgi:hypothetical protein
MTFEQAVNFILERLDVSAPDRRAMRDKVRKRVRYALGGGSLRRLDVQTTDMDQDEVIYWARSKWRGKFDIPIEVSAPMSDILAFADSAGALPLPSNIDQCHRLVRELAARNRLLEMMVHRQANIIDGLRPLAEQYERNRAKNQSSARKPRTG